MSKTVLITGSSTGIGRSTAMHFQSQGWNVIATMRTPEKERELQRLDRVLVTRLDVTDQDSINAAVQAGLDTFGSIDVLVNNAGYGAYGPLEATPMEKIRVQFETNVIGLMSVTQAVLPHMRQQASGTIINISSIGGKMAFPLGSLYHGTKYAVEGLTEALFYELDAIGVKAKLVEPGAIKTDFGGRSFNFNNDESMTEYQPIVQALMTNLAERMTEQASEPQVVADVIYTAATDGSKTLRYTAGDDAAMFMDQRKKQDDESLMSGVRQFLGM